MRLPITNLPPVSENTAFREAPNGRHQCGSIAGMSNLSRIAVSSLSFLCGFVVAFLVGFYVSFLFGANMHDTMPGIFGLGFGLAGGIFSFDRVWSRTGKSAG